LKPGPLTAEEFEQVKLHPIIGEQICQPLRAKPILNLVRHHHERYDGKGYPDGLKGEDIPLVARIMSIADAYEAMTSERPYRGRMPRERALAVLREEAGKQFDPALVSIFVDIMQRGSP
jgi:HD-GYP domain-containing protein (c-di-GMP phosphodiesterase class II)